MKIPQTVSAGFKKATRCLANLKQGGIKPLPHAKTQGQAKRDANLKIVCKQINGTIKSTREIMTAKELAIYLKISRHTIYQWLHESKLPFGYIQFDRAIRFDRADVDEWLEGRKVPPVSSFRNSS